MYIDVKDGRTDSDSHDNNDKHEDDEAENDDIYNMISLVKEEILTQHLKKETIKSTESIETQNAVDPVTISDKNEKKNDSDKTTVHVHAEKERLLAIAHDAGDASDANDASYQALNVIMLLATVIVAMMC